VNACFLIWTGSIQRRTADYTWDPLADCLHASRHIQSGPAKRTGRLRTLSFSLCPAFEFWRSLKLAVDRIEGEILEIQLHKLACTCSANNIRSEFSPIGVSSKQARLSLLCGTCAQSSLFIDCRHRRKIDPFSRRHSVRT